MGLGEVFRDHVLAVGSYSLSWAEIQRHDSHRVEQVTAQRHKCRQ